MAFRTLILLLFGAVATFTQTPFPGDPAQPPGGLNRGPDGRDRTQELLKAEHAQTLKDLATIHRLTEEVQMDLEKHDRHVFSVGALKKLEEIEKLSKRIRGRMKRF